MAAIVDGLRGQGYDLRTVDVDNEPELARRFGVTAVPCFIAVDGAGKETRRLEGLASAGELLYRRGNVAGSMDQVICDALRS